MGMKTKWIAALAAVPLLVTAPAFADSGPNAGMSGAEKLRRLDIMLMVTGLRCRTGADDFRGEYQRFTTAHLSELNAASDSMKADMARAYGAAGANRALDRLSVTMANAYGQGHPWLSCGELKLVAGSLAEMRGRAPLEEAADQLLAPVGGARQLAWARR